MLNLVGDLFDPELVLPILVFGIPIIAIVGGITAGIVKTVTESRVIENAQRERIAAIQAGMDPSRLPPLPALGSASTVAASIDPEAAARHRSQGLLIAGIITLFVGAGLITFLYIVVDSGDPVWAVGIIPLFVGLALFLCSWIVRPRRSTA